MAFDGITIAAMVAELHLNLDGGRFNKIAQPEADELLITGKGANGQCRLLLSASASLPLIYWQCAYFRDQAAGAGACGGV